MKRTQRLILIVLSAVLLSQLHGVARAAQRDPLQKDIQDLQKQVGEIQETQKTIYNELKEIRALLDRAKPAPGPRPVTDLTLDNHPTKGDKNSKLILVEFTDYQCPFCARHFRDTYNQIDKDYVKTGQLKYVLWDLPLQMHKEAFKAHEAAHCAGDQEKYWEMHDQLFQNQKLLAPAELPKHAAAVGLEPGSFQTCLDSGKHAAKVRKNLTEAEKLGINSTPAFFLATETSDPRNVRVISAIRGAYPYATFKDAIDKALKRDQ